MNVNNKKVIDKMVGFILSNVEASDIVRYYKQFPLEYDYNIYKYGNLDVMYWELEDRLREFGVIKNFKNNNDIESTYMWLVRLATNKIMKSIHKTKQRIEA